MEPKGVRKQARGRCMQHPTLLQYLVMSQTVISMKARASNRARRQESRTQQQQQQQKCGDQEVLAAEVASGRPDRSTRSPVIPNASFSPLNSPRPSYLSHSSDCPHQSSISPHSTSREHKTSQPHVGQILTASPSVAPNPPSSLLAIPLFVMPHYQLPSQLSSNHSDHGPLASLHPSGTLQDVNKSELPKLLPSPSRSPVPFSFISCKPTMDSSPIIVPQVLHIPLYPQSPR